ncbi:hypothetical protein CEXT_84631 [Caerostris extrusa]|uniref:Uncharacterized protein n=1 Tax=Caerostris extrusa TaxID=172846 RepID=A0AAV4XWY5_CAEEX|nr:hypothetical protein CEXT_84631 [Caerostris extrusa]
MNEGYPRRALLVLNETKNFHVMPNPKLPNNRNGRKGVEPILSRVALIRSSQSGFIRLIDILPQSSKQTTPEKTAGSANSCQSDPFTNFYCLKYERVVIVGFLRQGYSV